MFPNSFLSMDFHKATNRCHSWIYFLQICTLPHRRRITESVESKVLFSREECDEIEEKILEVCKKGERNGYKSCTVDRAHLRNKYYFGEGYVYGPQVRLQM